MSHSPSAQSSTSFLEWPTVSVVLPTWQGEADLRRLLPVLAGQNYPAPVEIVAFDSSSTDDGVALLQRAGARVQVISRAEFGHGKTRNRAVRCARHEVIVFLSQDAVPQGEDWLRALVEPLCDPRIGATFARQIARQGAGALESFAARYLYPNRSRRARAIQSEPPLDELFFSNVCSAARREVCLAFPFDETLVMSEDQFFARDLLMNGLDIFYNARAVVRHSHDYDLATHFRRHFDSGDSLRALNGQRPARQLARALHFVSHEVLYVTRGKQWRALAQLPLHEAARFAALLLGAQAPRLPRSIVRRLSLHRALQR